MQESRGVRVVHSRHRGGFRVACRYPLEGVDPETARLDSVALYGYGSFWLLFAGPPPWHVESDTGR